MIDVRRARHWAIGLLAVALGVAVGCHNGTENAIHSRDDADLRDRLDHGADPNERDSLGYTPLIYAARDGNAGAVQVLLRHRAQVNAQDNNGSTALMHAAEDGHREIARLLLNAGADPNLTNRKGYTALSYADANRQTEIADLIRAHGGR